jgi:tRNA modification GTPase
LIFAQVELSAKNKQSVDVLLEIIGKASHSDALENNEVIVTNLRHIEALTQALEALQRALTGLEKDITNDFLAMDIREVIHFLAGITGDEISTDEILGNIFKNFCIGK